MTLRRLRRKKGMTLRDLAEKSELDYSFIGRLERGEAGGSPRTWKALAEALGVDTYAISKGEAVADKVDAWDYERDCPKNYDPGLFYIRSTDSHGHYRQLNFDGVQVKVSPVIAARVQEHVEWHPVYRSTSDFIRNALIHHLVAELQQRGEPTEWAKLLSVRQRVDDINRLGAEEAKFVDELEEGLKQADEEGEERVVLRLLREAEEALALDLNENTKEIIKRLRKRYGP